MKRIIPHLKTALVAIAILVLSLSEPGPSVPKVYKFFAHIDKIAHFLMYFCLTVVMLSIYCYKRRPGIRILYVGLIALSYSVLIEFLQKHFTNSRQFEIADIFSNLAGIICATLLFMLWLKFRFGTGMKAK